MQVSNRRGDCSGADPIPGQFALVVELNIDPSKLEQFKAAIKENGETAAQVRAGMSKL
jgi:hypothetical protein